MYSYIFLDGILSIGSDEFSYVQSLVVDLWKDDNYLWQIFDFKVFLFMMILFFVFSIEIFVFFYVIIFGCVDDFSFSNIYFFWFYVVLYILQILLQFFIVWSFFDDFLFDVFVVFVLCICDFLWYFMVGVGVMGLLVGCLLQGVFEVCIFFQLVLKMQVYWC